MALKHAHRWAECLAACDRAVALAPDDSAGPRWNAGIAATALRDWARARDAWAGYGIDIPPGDGPLEMSIGFACVRLDPERESEVVYVKRVDPCRARIISIPLPESQRRFDDLVLHDGEPRGARQLGDARVSVFDELLLLERSPYATWRVTVQCDTPDERDGLLEIYRDVDGAIEDWTESVALLCNECSLGDVCHDHRSTTAAWRTERQLGLALRGDRELRRLRRFAWGWRRGILDVSRVL